MSLSLSSVLFISRQQQRFREIERKEKTRLILQMFHLWCVWIHYTNSIHQSENPATTKVQHLSDLWTSKRYFFLFSFLAREGLYWLPFLLFAPLESGIVKQVFSTFADTFYWHNFFNEKSSKKVRLRISCDFVHSARVRRIFFMTAICRNKNCKKNPWLFILCVLKCLKQTHIHAIEKLPKCF